MTAQNVQTPGIDRPLDDGRRRSSIERSLDDWGRFRLGGAVAIPIGYALPIRGDPAFPAPAKQTGSAHRGKLRRSGDH